MLLVGQIDPPGDQATGMIGIDQIEIVSPGSQIQVTIRIPIRPGDLGRLDISGGLPTLPDCRIELKCSTNILIIRFGSPLLPTARSRSPSLSQSPQAMDMLAISLAECQAREKVPFWLFPYT